MIRKCLLGVVFAVLCVAARAQVPGTPATAVEFFHPGFGHYFVSAQQDEIGAIDAGLFAGWVRTGNRWIVWLDGSGLADVCRFFTTFFAPKSSHFYTANAGECALVKQNPVWQYEKIAFKVALRNGQGACPIGIPLYRVYNHGQTGAPNHRYTTSLAIRAQMLAQGFDAEDENTVCVAEAPRSPAEGFWFGTTSAGKTLVLVVLDDGTFAALYTPIGNFLAFAGAVQGVSTTAGGVFASTGGKDFNFAAHLIGAGSVNANFTPKGTMTGTIVTTTSNEAFTVNYSPTYEQPASLPALAGTFTGTLQSATTGDLAALTVAAGTGLLTGVAGGCTIGGFVTPRDGVNLFDAVVTFAGATCGLGTTSTLAIGYYDPTFRRFVVAGPTPGRANFVMFDGTKP